MPHVHRHSVPEQARYRSSFHDTNGLFSPYPTRMMLGLVAALSLLLLTVHLPLYERPVYVDWRSGRLSAEEFTLSEVGPELRAKAVSETPITIFDEVRAIEKEEGGEDEVTAEEVAAPVEPERPPIDRSIQKVAVLSASEQMPQVVGGLGAYYIQIEYPPAARQAGIEGRLVLDFIVELDGRTSDIRVAQSLHPLCDSAAVRALRQTYFVPGHQNGEKVRVRMRLPVRFQLIERGRPPSLPTHSSAANTPS